MNNTNIPIITSHKQRTDTNIVLCINNTNTITLLLFTYYY